MLTKKQLELLLFIDEHLRKTGVSPSFEEMKEAVKLRSKSGIHRLVSALEERGFLRRLAHRARALEVLKMPATLGPAVQAPSTPRRGFEPSVIKGNFRPTLPAAEARPEAQSVELPLYGRIAAGTPIEALREHHETIDVPASLLGRGGHYALKVEGDSMIDAGIFDGDTVIVQQCDSADNGAIVVALIDETEVTLKRMHRKGESLALEPANPRYEARIFGPGRVRLQGRLVGLMRKY